MSTRTCRVIGNFQAGKENTSKPSKNAFSERFREELNVEVEVETLFESVEHEYPDKWSLSAFIPAGTWEGKPRLRVPAVQMGLSP